jgi:RNA polymerase sigma factor (sigma-70 family)
LRLRCLLQLGIDGVELEKAKEAQLALVEVGSLERLPTLIDRAHRWREGGQWLESRAAVDELKELFPIDEPLGLWARISAARSHLTAFFEPERALELVTDVVAKAGSMAPWDEAIRVRIAATHVGPVQPYRKQAATLMDTQAQALHLRGFVLNQLQRHAEAIADLERALPLFKATDCVHREANCHQELAEAKLMLHDPSWREHADAAMALFKKGWAVFVEDGPIQPDDTGIVSIRRSEAIAHHRKGDYEKAEDGYREFLVHWTKSDDPLRVPQANLVNLDYHLTAVWLAECLLMQEDPKKQHEGEQWFRRLDADASQFRLQHAGFLRRLALVRAIVKWRSGEHDKAVSYLNNAMQDPSCWATDTIWRTWRSCRPSSRSPGEMDDQAETIALITASQAGDQHARERLFARCLPRVRQMVALRVGVSIGALPAHAEDVVQDTLLSALKALPRFQPRTIGAFHGWLARIAENRLRNEARQRSSRKAGPRPTTRRPRPQRRAVSRQRPNAEQSGSARGAAHPGRGRDPRFAGSLSPRHRTARHRRHGAWRDGVELRRSEANCRKIYQRAREMLLLRLGG